MADMPIELYRLKVSKGAKLVLSYLWRYAGRDRFVWVDRERISEDLGIESERTLRRNLGELLEAEVIEKDTQRRAGRMRSGWWLHVDSGTSETSELHAEQTGEQERPPADRNGRGRSEMAAARIPPRPFLAAESANSGRTNSIELPRTKILSDRPSEIDATSEGEDPGREDTVRAGLNRLRRWRLEGGDPEGLGRWPSPVTPNGLPLPTLSMGGKLEELLRQERTPEELHLAVHLIAELVEAGKLPASQWRATYVFSGWLDELVVKGLEWRARRSWRARQGATQAEDVETGAGPPCSLQVMLEELERSPALRSVASDVQRRRAPEHLDGSIEAQDDIE